MKRRVAKAFIRLESSLLRDEPPGIDPLYLASLGIEQAAPIVLRVLQQHVLPVVRNLAPKQFWFLVHSRNSGVPTSETDHIAYLDLTMVFDRAPRFPSGAPWTMMSEQPLRVIGTNGALPAGWTHLRAAQVHELLHAQAELLLKFVEMHKDLEDRVMLRHLRQYLHYFANISQMRIS